MTVGKNSGVNDQIKDTKRQKERPRDQLLSREDDFGSRCFQGV